MPSLSKIKSELKKTLGQDRYGHSLRVMHMAQVLAKRYRVAVNRAALAGLLHDCSRGMEPRRFISSAKKFGIKVSQLEKKYPKLLHAPLSAKIAQRKFKVKDKGILRAIARHTLGAQKMSLLDKIIYLADHIEDRREYAGVAKIRKLAFRDMDKAIVASTSAMIKFLMDEKLAISAQTVLTRNAHLR